MAAPIQQINQFITSYFRYLAAAVVVIVGVAFWQFLLLPQYTAIQDSGLLQYHNITQTVQQHRNYVQQLQELQRSYDQFDHRTLRYLDVALPEEYSEADTFAEIDQLFRATSLAVQSINVAAIADASATDAATTATADQAYQVVLVTVNVTARQAGETTEAAKLSYSDFKTILQRIEQQQHLLNLEQLVYSPDTNAFTLILKTYQRTKTETTL